MIEEIADSKLQRVLRTYLFKHPKDLAYMKSIAYCGSRVSEVKGVAPGVLVFANDKDAKIFGVNTCKNAWCCPTCSARVMAKYAAEIASAIDALEKWKNQYAFMVTLTVPHTSGMSVLEITEILYNAWKDFIVHGNKNQNAKYYANAENKFKHNQEKTMKVSTKKLNDPFATFCEIFNCTYRVRVGEFTFGSAGAHPHFHCLFWVDSDKLQKVAEYEEMLRDRWTALVKKHTLKMWDRAHPEKKADNRTRLEIMYSKLNEGSNTLYISKDDKGAVIKQLSSHYICGWGADREVTGNYKNKASNEGHETPRQLLERAATGDESAMRLFLEFAFAVRTKKHRRINFSKNTKDIIKKWRQTEAFTECMKKKHTDMVRKNGLWRMVCWFTKAQWFDICLKDRAEPVIQRILEMATQTDGRKLIRSFLEEYDIILTDKKYHDEELITEIMNSPFGFGFEDAH